MKLDHRAVRRTSGIGVTPKLARSADMILAGAAGLTALMSAYLLYQHGWAFQYLGLVVLAGVFCSGLWLPPEVKLTGALLFVSLAASLYSAEGLVYYLGPLTWNDRPDFSHGLTWSRDSVDDRAERAQSMGQSFDTRDRLQVIRDLEAQGVPAYPPIAGNMRLDIDGQRIWTLSGIANAMTVSCNESGQYMMYLSDERGFHNPHGLWNGAPVEIAVIGDSFAHGACVPSDQNFAALIRARYPRTLNLGLGAVGPLQELALLKEYGSVVRPSIVLWTYCESTDLTDLTEPQDSLYDAYLTPDYFQGLITKQTAIDQALLDNYRRVRREIAEAPSTDSLMTLAERFVKVTALRTRMRHLRVTAPPPATDHAMDLFERVLREAARVTDQWGGQLIMGYLPGYERYTHPRLANPDRQRVLSLVKQMGVAVIDLHPVFAAHRDPVSLFPFGLSGHYTEEGNRLVATTILSELSRITVGHDM